jgi:hypothetical protein
VLVMGGFLLCSLSVANAAPHPAAPSDVLFARIERLLRGRTLDSNVTLTQSQHSQLMALAARFTGPPSASRIADLRKFLAGFVGPQKAGQLNALVGYVIHAALLPRAQGLDDFLDGLNSKLAESRKLRAELKCSEDAAGPSQSWMQLSRATCSPTAKPGAVAQLDVKLQKVQDTAGKLRAVALVAAGPIEQLKSSLLDVSSLSDSTQDLLAVFMKLQTESDEQPDEREQLEMQLLKEQMKYDAYQEQCSQGDAVACSKLPEIAATIADLEAQIAAL